MCFHSHCGWTSTWQGSRYRGSSKKYIGINDCFYDVLAVNPSDNEHTIGKSYRRVSKLCIGNGDESDEIIRKAYEVLISPEARKKYDLLKSHGYVGMLAGAIATHNKQLVAKAISSKEAVGPTDIYDYPDIELQNAPNDVESESDPMEYHEMEHVLLSDQVVQRRVHSLIKREAPVKYEDRMKWIDMHISGLKTELKSKLDSVAVEKESWITLQDEHLTSALRSLTYVDNLKRLIDELEYVKEGIRIEKSLSSVDYDDGAYDPRYRVKPNKKRRTK